MLEYKIVEKAQFTLVGKAREFHMDTSYEEIPKFWDEHMQGEESGRIMGMYGVCIDSDGKNFVYLIADDDVPWEEIPSRLAGSYNLERYTMGQGNPEDDYSEIWIPVEKI